MHVWVSVAMFSLFWGKFFDNIKIILTSYTNHPGIPTDSHPSPNCNNKYFAPSSNVCHISVSFSGVSQAVSIDVTKLQPCIRDWIHDLNKFMFLKDCAILSYQHRKSHDVSFASHCTYPQFRTSNPSPSPKIFVLAYQQRCEEIYDARSEVRNDARYVRERTKIVEMSLHLCVPANRTPDPNRHSQMRSPTLRATLSIESLRPWLCPCVAFERFS